VILPAPFAQENNITIGDPITLEFGGHAARMVVRGILEARGPATAVAGEREPSYAPPRVPAILSEPGDSIHR